MELRILTWLFPLLMAVLEFLLRASASGKDPYEFIGPTIGGAALGMLLPFTRVKISHEPADQNSVQTNTGKVYMSDHHWAQSINVLLWIGLTAWATSLYLGIHHGSPYFPNVDGVRTSILIGLILWLCAVGVDFLRGGKP
jgi:hypothetical protein